MSSLYIIISITFANSFLVFLLYKRYKGYLRGKRQKKKKIKTTLILGPGGHSREMIEIYDILNHEKHDFNFVHSTFDHLSRKLLTQKILKSSKYEGKEENQQLKEKTLNSCFYTIPFPTNKMILYSLAITLFIINTLKSLIVSYKLNPDLVITNGPGLSVPFCMAIKLLNLLLLRNTKIVYVESLTRVRTLSVSGRLLRKIVDQFVVLWPKLQTKYKNSTYLGTINKLPF